MGNYTFIIYNREINRTRDRDRGREREREEKIERDRDKNWSLKQQHAAGQNTTSREQACPIEDQLLHFKEIERERERERQRKTERERDRESKREINK